MKKSIKKFITFCILALLLDFIPIKWAINIEGIKNFKTNEYLCSFAQVTGGNWQVKNNIESYESGQLYFEYLHEKDPFNVLDKNFSTDYLEPSGNMYVFTGKIINKEHDMFDLKVESWEITYPIQRKSLRMLYTPKKYLTIYDYDWLKIIVGLIKKP